jgi:transcription elongation factor/antiterminator RfaH
MNSLDAGCPETVLATDVRMLCSDPAGLGSGSLCPQVPAFIEIATERADGRAPVIPSSADTCARWHVVHTHPHAEDRAIDNLERQSFETFCPRIRKTVRHARKVAHVLAPMFPSYLFVRLDVKRDRWRSINGTHGVVRILTQGEIPLPVPRGVVEALRARTGGEGAIDLSTSLKVGDVVKISNGPFSDFVGTLDYLDGAGRVRVLLDLMGRAVSVVTRSQMVALAG